MLNTQAIADKSAIVLSVLCALHCLLLPVAIILYPHSVTFLPDDELFHFSILLIVIPISIFALYKGAQIHSSSFVFIVGLSGLATLILALFFGHSILGAYGEKIFTLIGSLIVIYAHFRNFLICREKDCYCHPEVDL